MMTKTKIDEEKRFALAHSSGGSQPRMARVPLVRLLAVVPLLTEHRVPRGRREHACLSVFCLWAPMKPPGFSHQTTQLHRP